LNEVFSSEDEFEKQKNYSEKVGDIFRSLEENFRSDTINIAVSKIKHFNDLSLDEFYEIAKSRYEVFACEQKIFSLNDYDDIDKS
ncbi:hypothetical protein ACTPEM_25320, partial [Clostridioides difficile]